VASLGAWCSGCRAATRALFFLRCRARLNNIAQKNDPRMINLCGVIRFFRGYSQPAVVSIWRFCQTAARRLSDTLIHGKRGGFSRRGAETQRCFIRVEPARAPLSAIELNATSALSSPLLSSLRLSASARERLPHDSSSVRESTVLRYLPWREINRSPGTASRQAGRRQQRF